MNTNVAPHPGWYIGNYLLTWWPSRLYKVIICQYVCVMFTLLWIFDCKWPKNNAAKDVRFSFSTVRPLHTLVIHQSLLILQKIKIHWYFSSQCLNQTACAQNIGGGVCSYSIYGMVRTSSKSPVTLTAVIFISSAWPLFSSWVIAASTTPYVTFSVYQKAFTPTYFFIICLLPYDLFL